MGDVPQECPIDARPALAWPAARAVSSVGQSACLTSRRSPVRALRPPIRRTPCKHGRSAHPSRERRRATQAQGTSKEQATRFAAWSHPPRTGRTRRLWRALNPELLRCRGPPAVRAAERERPGCAPVFHCGLPTSCRSVRGGFMCTSPTLAVRRTDRQPLFRGWGRRAPDRARSRLLGAGPAAPRASARERCLLVRAPVFGRWRCRWTRIARSPRGAGSALVQAGARSAAARAWAPGGVRAAVPGSPRSWLFDAG